MIVKSGVCRVLGVYWELIPHATIKALIVKLVDDLASDASVTSVRAAVFEGLSFVLDNPLSHLILKALLPKLHNHIFDRYCLFRNLSFHRSWRCNARVVSMVNIARNVYN
jgi:condensin-2 complex subunit G2